MKYKKSLIFICLIICLFSIASVCASEVNETVVADEDQNNDLIEIGTNENNDLLGAEEQDVNDVGAIEEQIGRIVTANSSDDGVLTVEKDEDILGDSQYTISSFSGSHTINFGSSGLMNIVLHPVDQNVPYSYHFYVQISKSTGSLKVWKEFSGDTYNSPAALYNIKRINYSFGNDLEPGDYTAQLVNNFGGSALKSFSFTVKDVYDAGQTDPSDYNFCSVTVKDTTINNGFSGNIIMSVSCRHGYNFNLYVYDSKNVAKIYKNYYNPNGGTYSLTYTISPTSLSSGVYTIKIINEKDKSILSVAKLTIGDGISPTPDTNPVPSQIYSVSVKDVSVIHGQSARIEMSIFLNANSDNYHYYSYSFYLKVYDSDNVEKYSKLYSGNTNKNFSKYETFNTEFLNPGSVYTIKIIDYGLNYVITNAKLYIYSTTFQYSVHISNSSKFYSPNNYVNHISFSLYTEYLSVCFYDLKVEIYDSNNVLKQYQNFSGKFTSNHNIKFSINLDLGVYTVRILNRVNNDELGVATLKVLTVPTQAFSVNINDTNITCYYSSRDITMSIAYNMYYDYAYKYDFYLKFYDSNGLEVYNKRFYNDTKKEIITFSIGAKTLRPGVYTMKIVGTVDNKTMETAKLIVTSVNYWDYKVEIIDTIITYNSSDGFNVTITAKYKRYDFYLETYDSNGIKLFSERFFSSNSPSTSVKSLKFKEILHPGDYVLRVRNSQDNRLMDSAKISVKSVSYNNYSVNVEDISINYLDDGVIPVYISPAMSNMYKYDFYLKIYNSENIEVFSERYYNTTPNDSIIYQFGATTFSPGLYEIKIFNTEDNHLMCSSSLKINKIISNISTFDVINSYNSNEFWMLSLEDIHGVAISDAIVSIDLNGVKTYTTDKYGHIRVSTKDLVPNNYTAKIIFEGDDYYSESSTTARVIIIKDTTTITSHNLSTIYNGDDYLFVTLRDSQGELIKNGILSVDFNGINRIISLVNGQAKISTNGLSPNSYVVNISFVGNELYEKSSAVVNVNVKKGTSELNANVITAIYNINKVFEITLKDSKGKSLSGVKVIVNLNGVKTLITDKNGQIRIVIKSFVPKKYAAEITFKDNGNYTGLTKTVNVIVKKATPKLTAKAKSFKKSVKTKKYAVTLKDNTGKAMKKVKITLKIKNKKFTAKTNKKGKATFKIKKFTKKGTFKAKITFKGNVYYKKVTKKVKIKIK